MQKLTKLLNLATKNKPILAAIYRIEKQTFNVVYLQLTLSSFTGLAERKVIGQILIKLTILQH